MQHLNALSEKTVRLAVGAVIGVAVLIAVLDYQGGDGTPAATERGDAGAVALGAAELRERAAALPHPVFWLGERPEASAYELSSAADGTASVRYLTGGAAAGADPAAFITVGSYPVADARAALDSIAASNPDAELVEIEGATLLLAGAPNSVYVVFAATPDTQVEIYSPVPDEAATLAQSGELVPLG